MRSLVCLMPTPWPARTTEIDLLPIEADVSACGDANGFTVAPHCTRATCAGAERVLAVRRGTIQEAIMNEDMLNMSVRKFLKKVGVTSQREIEEAVRLAVISGQLKGNEVLPAKVKLMVGGIDLSVEIEGSVELE
jgi:Family of unknown function (DUF6494)